ncbi:V-type ATP synthase subunit A, partial [Candidatus Micrarchaeota archaeon]|nr:V-type ATP synthase subunit A [Candidatus Micrarchaeota archaeon]
MGEIAKISGPLIIASGMRGSQINEVVKVGKQELNGEIIALKEDRASIQVYEETSGLKPGDVVNGTGAQLELELGPGLLSGIFDGTQRPLDVIREKTGIFIARGVNIPSINRKTKWDFKATAKKGEHVKGGDCIGEVQEKNIIHKILVPPKVEGKIEEIKEGKFTVEETIAIVGGHKLTMMQKWPVRTPRPFKSKKPFDQPLVTGMRIIDTFFPVAMGGAAAIPGPFGSGKCVSGRTPILLADGDLITMEELYERAQKKGVVKKNAFEEIIELYQPLEVLSLSVGEIRKAKATAVYKGKSDKLLRIKTRSGRILEVTPVHKLFKITPELQVIETPAQALTTGEFIATARKLPELESKAEFDIYQLETLRAVEPEIRAEIKQIVRNRVKNIGTKAVASELGFTIGEVKRLSSGINLPTLKQVKRVYGYYKMPLPAIKLVRGDRRGAEVTIPTRMTSELAEFLGLFIAEGYLRGNRTLVFTNSDEKLLSRFAELSQKLFGASTRVERQKDKTPNVLLSSRAVIEYMKGIGADGNASTKRIPQAIISASNDCIASFLRAYFIGDGSFSKNDVEFTTASIDLRTGVSFLLSRMAVPFAFGDRTIGGKKYYRIFVRGKPALQRL